MGDNGELQGLKEGRRCREEASRQLGVGRGCADFEAEELAIAVFPVSQCVTRSSDALGSPVKLHLDLLTELERVLARPQNGRDVGIPGPPDSVNDRVASRRVIRRTEVVDRRAGAHADKIDGWGQ